MNAARYASLIAFAQSRGFCPTGEGGGIDNSCGGSGKGSDYDPGHFDVGPDPNGLTEKDLMYSPTVKWTQDHKSLVRDAVKSWKGSPTDMTLHVMSELKGEGIPGSGSGKIMRAQATALLNEVLDNGEPAPTLYRGASIPPEQDPSPLLGWTSKKSVAEAFAKKNNGEVYTLEGASGLNTSKIKAHGMGEAEWIVPHKIPDGYIGSTKKEMRAFCPTGEGNGVDNSCGSGQSSQSFPKGSKNLRDAVDSVAPEPEQVWDRSRGLAETPSPKQMDDIANEQTSHSGSPLTPEAEASYGSLVDEIGRQYEALTAAGLKARAWRGEGEPYGDPPGSTKPNSNKMREEVAKTGEFSFFMTDKGFGTGDATPNHPMLRETKYKTADGEPMIANDLFRVVHDMVAHVRGGFSFSTNGEYNGMLTHASTLPEAAWPALFAETFGQNAVYEKTKNYAPQNAYASKVGPEIIRSELKKRTKSSRAKKDDGDEPLGYQHVKSRPWLLKSLVEARSADCARDDDGRFASGNKCGGSVDMPKEDPRGRMRYDNGVQTDAARKLYQMGSSEKKLKELVDVMGGDPKNTKVDINPPSLNISVADKDGNKLFHVDFENGRARLYPAKDLSKGEIDRIKDAAGEAFASTNADTKVVVYGKADDIKKWESENAAKIKKWEDKYAFSTLLPPHQRPKKWERSLDARYASLLAFAESRDCGQDADGKFSKGNTCASGLAADVASSAAKGAALGAASGFGKTFTPQGAASGAAYGAVAGAVKGIYDNKMRPTRVSERITRVGLTDEKVAAMVKGLGGTGKSLASTNGKSGLTLTIRGKGGKVSHVVDISDKKVSIYPMSGRREMTDEQIATIKKVASDVAPKETTVVVKTNSLSYASRLAKKGFSVAASKAGVITATALVSAAAPSVPDAVLGTVDLYFDTHFTDSFYNAKRR
jgi:hypothetical protein